MIIIIIIITKIHTIFIIIIIISGAYNSNICFATEPDCPPRMEYSANISSCPRSCQHPLDSDSCETAVNTSCVCSRGLLQQNNTCVEPEQCGCFREDGRNVKVCYIKQYILLYKTPCTLLSEVPPASVTSPSSSVRY